jgi:hypothetical protein
VHFNDCITNFLDRSLLGNGDTRQSSRSTQSLDLIETLHHVRFSDLIVNKVVLLDENGVNISAIPDDGASYQVRALDFEEVCLIQMTQPRFRAPLFVGRSCHRLNDANHELYRKFQLFQHLIQQL